MRPTWMPRSMMSPLLSSASSSYVRSSATMGVISRSRSSSYSSSTSSARMRCCWKLRAVDLATSRSSWRSSDPTFSLISVSRSWLASSSLGPRYRQSRENLRQLVHGCDLLHFSLRRRHSRHDVIMRIRRRIGFEGAAVSPAVAAAAVACAAASPPRRIPMSAGPAPPSGPPTPIMPPPTPPGLPRPSAP